MNHCFFGKRCPERLDQIHHSFKNSHQKTWIPLCSYAFIALHYQKLQDVHGFIHEVLISVLYRLGRQQQFDYQLQSSASYGQFVFCFLIKGLAKLVYLQSVRPEPHLEGSKGAAEGVQGQQRCFLYFLRNNLFNLCQNELQDTLSFQIDESFVLFAQFPPRFKKGLIVDVFVVGQQGIHKMRNVLAHLLLALATKQHAQRVKHLSKHITTPKLRLLLQQLAASLNEDSYTWSQTASNASQAAHHFQHALLHGRSAFLQVVNDRSQQVVDDGFYFPEVAKLEEEVGETGKGVANDAWRIVYEQLEQVGHQQVKVFFLKDWLEMLAQLSNQLQSCKPHFGVGVEQFYFGSFHKALYLLEFLRFNHQLGSHHQSSILFVPVSAAVGVFDENGSEVGSANFGPYLASELAHLLQNFPAHTQLHVLTHFHLPINLALSRLAPLLVRFLDVAESEHCSSQHLLIQTVEPRWKSSEDFKDERVEVCVVAELKLLFLGQHVREDGEQLGKKNGRLVGVTLHSLIEKGQAFRQAAFPSHSTGWLQELKELCDSTVDLDHEQLKLAVCLCLQRALHSKMGHSLAGTAVAPIKVTLYLQF